MSFRKTANSICDLVILIGTILLISISIYNNYGLLILEICMFSLVIHEWGHYIPMYFYDTRPRFIYGWWGIGVTGFRSHLKLTENIVVVFMGVLIGALPLVVLQIYHLLPNMILVGYLVVCSADFLLIFSDIVILSRYGNRKNADMSALC